jgi:hypothetical protein
MKKIIYIVILTAALAMVTSPELIAQGTNSTEKGARVRNLTSWQVYPASKLVISPNPASRQAEINPYRVAAKEGFTLEVLDMKGRSLIRRPWQGEKLDVSTLAAGMYVVTLRNAKQTFTQKLAVVRD